MKTTCLINSYNYRRFVGEAVDSALAQTVPFDEILIIDDGSTDGSFEWLTTAYAAHRQVTIVSQPNRGQLSCFNEGFGRSTGDILFFLDADDLYEPDYVEQALRVYQADPAVDFVFAGFRWYGAHDRPQPHLGRDADVGYSVLSTLALRAWVGGPTSCNSMRRWVLDSILPVPFLDQWRTRADDCLIFGSSLSGARKYRLARPLIKYRLHGANRFAGRRTEPRAEYRRRLAINRLFQYFVERMGYDRDTLAELAHSEFRTIPAPTWRLLTDYMRLVFGARLRFSRKLSLAGSVLRHYLWPGHGGADSGRAAPGNTAAVDKVGGAATADDARSAA